MGNKNRIIHPVIFNEKKNLPFQVEIIDGFNSALIELFFIRNPRYKKDMKESELPLKKFIKNSEIKPVWVYYPWRDKIICIPEERIFFELRTARNRNLITDSVQMKYRNMTVGIIGLSVGSPVNFFLSYTGGPRTLKLADFDKIEITNLNRIHASLLDIGVNKTRVAAERIWEIDPFAKLSLWDKGVNEMSLRSFIEYSPKIDIFIDEMDTLPLKIKSRIICRENRIPVLMATSNGNNTIIDVERFDIHPEAPLLHNRLGNISTQDFKYLNYEEWLGLANKIIGEDFLTSEMKKMIPQIGQTIASVPQLATTVNLGGIALAYIVRKIAEDAKNIPSGRYLMNMEDIFRN